LETNPDYEEARELVFRKNTVQASGDR
jgi:hypothetical protein